MIRIQRKRTKCWRMPENAVYVGRGTVYGNPFRTTGTDRFGRTVTHTAAEVVQLYREWLGPDGAILYPDLAAWRMRLVASLDALRGHDLACWCALDVPCHADVLIELLCASACSQA